jgi:integrase
VSVDPTSHASHGPSVSSLMNSADFCLSPEEVAKGEEAAKAYVNSLKGTDGRRSAEEALDTIAAVITNGVCDSRSFPWHQMRAHHGALAISLVKENGAPARIEMLRCRNDSSRKYQPVPESYLTKQIQTMKKSMHRVVAQCRTLGFISEHEAATVLAPRKAAAAMGKANGRDLTNGEVQALLSACDMDESISSSRDALMISIAYAHGLRTVDLINMSLDDMIFDKRTGNVTLRIKPANSKRARRLPLSNEDLIALEDWLERRGREPGQLFCPVSRGRHVEIKRMSAADVKALCDARAEQAGVLPFAPNDLAKSSLAAAAEKKRRANDNGSSEPQTQPSPLFPEDMAVEEVPSEPLISFPYRARMGD